MSKCTIRNIDFLKSLQKCKQHKTRCNIFDNATKDQIQCITEIAQNTLKGRIRYGKKALDRLKRFKRDIREVSKKRLSIVKKKTILKQRGGFIPALITPVITAVLSGVLSKIIEDHI